nr:MAG TPA: hemolysin [Caudoviricetes sp.]
MSAVIVALIGAGGSAVGAVLGVVINTKLITYRLEQLENKVNKHNNIIERTYNLEARLDVDEERLKVANHRIDDLESNGGTLL